MGFQKEILTAGNGPKPVKGQKVTVHCTGYGSRRLPKPLYAFPPWIRRYELRVQRSLLLDPSKS
jgi:hypothetical protein